MSTNRMLRVLTTSKAEDPYDGEQLSFEVLEDTWSESNTNDVQRSYIGLQQGTIDAQENPYEVIVSSKLYEQQDYVVETNHLPHYISLIVSDEFYNNLSKDQQKIIDQASQTAKVYAREASDKRIADRIKIIEDSGTKIVKLDTKTQKEMRKQAQPVYDAIKKSISKIFIMHI